MGTLFIVGTPIGNLEDMTLRAVRVLKEADVIVCEDTRMTKRLLQRYEIQDKQLTTYNEKATSVSTSKIIAWLAEGKKVAVVTDAGTPGISDPGGLLVQAIRAQMPEVKIEAVPGPSALATAISISGVPMARFTFLGFLPHKKGRETIFKEIASAEHPHIFYESPHRILKTLEALATHAPLRQVVVLRELTKVFEERVAGTPAEVLAHFTNNPDTVRGEFVVIVA